MHEHAYNQVTFTLKRLRHQLTLTPTYFAQLWQDHASLWQTLGWSEAQARQSLHFEASCFDGHS